MEQEGNSVSDVNREMRKILSEFLSGVINIEAGCVNAYDSVQIGSNGSLEAVEKPSKIYSSEEQGEESISEMNEATLQSFKSVDATGCASIMAVVYSMVKRDYMMQERIVSSLGLNSSSDQLESYCLMWSLRPFVNDDIIHEAINNIR